jgi:hypothetical protein
MRQFKKYMNKKKFSKGDKKFNTEGPEKVTRGGLNES